MVSKAKIHSGVGFFMEMWFICLQYPIFWIFGGLFKIDLLL